MLKSNNCKYCAHTLPDISQ